MRTIVKTAVLALTSLLFAGAVPPSQATAQRKAVSPETSGPVGSEFASGKDVRTQVAAMLAEMKPGQGFSWRPLVRDGQRVVAIEVWKKPGRPAIHPTEAEYAIVLEGAGALVSGGTLIAPTTRRDDLVEGERIEGGRTRTLHPGDVLLLPAGVPHWFGITGDRLVLLGTKLPAGK